MLRSSQASLKPCFAQARLRSSHASLQPGRTRTVLRPSRAGPSVPSRRSSRNHLANTPHSYHQHLAIALWPRAPLCHRGNYGRRALEACRRCQPARDGTRCETGSSRAARRSAAVWRWPASLGGTRMTCQVVQAPASPRRLPGISRISRAYPDPLPRIPPPAGDPMPRDATRCHEMQRGVLRGNAAAQGGPLPSSLGPSLRRDFRSPPCSGPPRATPCRPLLGPLAKSGKARQRPDGRLHQEAEEGCGAS